MVMEWPLRQQDMFIVFGGSKAENLYWVEIGCAIYGPADSKIYKQVGCPHHRVIILFLPNALYK